MLEPNPRRRTALIETVGLLVAMIGLAALLGALIGGPFGIALALGMAVFGAFGGSNAPTALILRMWRARPLSRWQAPRLRGMVDELARRANLPEAPLLFLLPSPTPNAAALGTPDQPVLVVSRGLLQQLSPREMYGVLAHEMAHVAHGDVTTMRLTASLAQVIGALSLAGMITWFASVLLAGDEIAAMPFTALLLFASAPTLVTLMQLALSRQREFAADARAVQLAGDAGGLASALLKLEHWRSRMAMLAGRMVGMPPSWLATHPATPARIERLRDIAGFEPYRPVRRPPQRLMTVDPWL